MSNPVVKSVPDKQEAPMLKTTGKASWTPQMMAEHKAMMGGVPEMATAPGKGEPKTDYEAKNAYRKAFEEHVGNFLNGALKGPSGETVQHREEALTHAHVAGLKAVQALKKGGVKMRVFAD